MENVRIVYSSLITIIAISHHSHFAVNGVVSMAVKPLMTDLPPKVTLYNNNDKQNGLFENNRTVYYLSKEETKKVVFECQSRLPNRWVWREGDELVKSAEVEKERKQMNESSIFLSTITVFFTLDKEAAQGNFSCINEIENEQGLHLVTCVSVELTAQSEEISLDRAEPLTISVFQVDRIEKCTGRENKDTGPGCPVNLTVDTTRMKGFCQSNDKPKSRSCRDLDHCRSLIYLNARNESCEGTLANFNSTSKEKTIIDTNVKFPQIALCEIHLDYDNNWLSFILFYPSWKGSAFGDDFHYYGKMMDALQHNSIHLIAPSQNDIAVGNYSAVKTGRHEFADGENVVFVCRAFSFLYMRGFRLIVGSTYSNGTVLKGPMSTDNNNKHFHIAQQNVILNTTKYGNVSWISCEGPIWNSRDWFNSTINISIYPAEKPYAMITHSKTNGLVTFNCTYWGWPRPNVTWAYSEAVNVTKQSGHMPDAESYNMSWSQIQTMEDPYNGLRVTCAVKNFYADHSASLILEDKAKKLLIIVVSCSIAGIVTIAILLFITFYWRYRKKLLLYGQHQQFTAEDIEAFYNGAAENTADYEALYLPYDNDYEIKQNELVLDGSILGSGQFGIVLKGNMGDLTVAVKTIKPTADVIYFKSLLSELKILQFVGRHRNIVNLIGANTNNIKKREVLLILDYCSNGSLVSFLRQSRDRFVNFFGHPCRLSGRNPYPLYENSKEITITTQNLIIFSCEIASAMEHLATKNVIHGDLAARNVLVTDDLHAKVCDFGLAKQLLHYSVYVQKVDCPLPLRWMAIESLQDMEFSLASDRWSYGVCLWEIFSLAEIPYPGEQWSFASYKMLQEGYRMAKPTYANDSIYKLMLRLWDAQPAERPTFQYIKDELRKEEDSLS